MIAWSPTTRRITDRGIASGRRHQWESDTARKGVTSIIVHGNALVSGVGGEDITETLEVVPRRWKVIHAVREKLPADRARGSPSRRRRSIRRAVPRRGKPIG